MDAQAGSGRCCLPGKAEPRAHECCESKRTYDDEYATPADPIGNHPGERGAEEIPGDHHCQVAAERDLSFRYRNEIADDGERHREYSARGNPGEHP